MSHFSSPASARSDQLFDLAARLAAREAFLQAANGSSVYSMGQAHDEAQLLRQAREALLQSEIRFRALLENNADVITLIAADGTILYDSPAVLTVMGYRQMELAGQNVFTHFDTEHLPEGREALERLLAGPGSTVSLTLRCRHKNGSYRWVEATGTNLLHESAVNAIVVNYRDVTERVEAAAALRESEQKFRQVVHALPTAVYLCDAKGRITHFNEAAAVLWGRAPLLGQDLWCGSWKIFNPDGSPLPPEACPMSVTIREGRAGHGREVVIQRPDGSRRTVQTYLEPLRDKAGILTGAIAMLVDVTAQKQREAEVLRQAEFARFNPNPVIELSADGGLNYCNAAAGEMARLLNRDHPGQILPAEAGVIVRECLASGKPHLRHETQVDDHIISWSFFPIAGRDVVHCYAGDITERKRSDTILRASEKLFKAMFAQAAVGVAQTDATTGRFVQINRRYGGILGYTPVEMQQLTFAQLTHPDEVETDLQHMARLRSGFIREYTREKRYRRKDGSFVWVNLTVSAMWAPGEKPDYFVTVVQDISARKQAELALRENAAFTADILNSLTAHVVVLDPQGTIIAVNEAWRNYARDNGVTATDFLGHNYLAACAVGAGQDYGVGADEAREGIRAVLDGTRPSFSLEYACHSPSQERWFLMRVSPLSGAQRGVVLTHSNITDRKHLEEQLRQSQKMEAIGQLAAGVAHDFNNLLTVIKGHIGLLRIKDRIAPEIKGSVQQIDEAADRASKLTRQLLTFSRQQALQPADHNLNTLATGLTRMLGRILGEHIDLTVDCAAVPLLIRADEGMVEQVLLNLAVNARDAMPKGGKLRITTGRAELDSAAERDRAPASSGPFVWLAVSDTGTGIAPEILPRIFEPFFTTKEVGKGTGLGLATVYNIMQQHGGWVAVESEVGQGTTFRAYFPQVTARTAKAPAASLAAHLPGGHEGILLVEDELTVRVAAEQTLTDLGYRVFSAASALPALQLWEEHQHRIDLLLTDLVMPDGINGRELAQRLQTLERALPVVYMSGYSHEAAGRDFPLKEGQNYLSKPFDVTALAKIVRASLDRRNTKDPFPAIAV